MAKKASINTIQIPWWVNIYSVVGAAIISLFTIVGIGYKIGSYFKEQECELGKKNFEIEKLQMRQEFQEKLQKEINECKEYKLTIYSKSVDELKNVVNQLSRENNGEKN